VARVARALLVVVVAVVVKVDFVFECPQPADWTCLISQLPVELNWIAEIIAKEKTT